MKLKLIKLFCWHLVFFFLFYELRVTLANQNFNELASWFELKDGLLNLSSLLVFSLYAITSYLIFFFFYPQSIGKIVLALLIAFLTIIALRYFIEEVFYLYLFGIDNYYDGMSNLSYVLGNLFYAILHISFGCVFFFFQYSTFKAQKEQSLLIENKRTELAYLRSQINPHFLFNTLNNIYSLVYQKSDKALPALEKLTAMLRFTLYESHERIALEKEIHNIKNFIMLEEIRYAYPLNVNFKIEGNYKSIMIPPFILLPFVENAFKHGDMKAPLSIHLKVSDQALSFVVHNQIKEKQKDKTGGIGLENIKKRLELIYGNDHQLSIIEQPQSFDVQLKLLNLKP